MLTTTRSPVEGVGDASRHFSFETGSNLVNG